MFVRGRRGGRRLRGTCLALGVVFWVFVWGVVGGARRTWKAIPTVSSTMYLREELWENNVLVFASGGRKSCCFVSEWDSSSIHFSLVGLQLFPCRGIQAGEKEGRGCNIDSPKNSYTKLNGVLVGGFFRKLWLWWLLCCCGGCRGRSSWLSCVQTRSKSLQGTCGGPPRKRGAKEEGTREGECAVLVCLGYYEGVGVY